MFLAILVAAAANSVAVLPIDSRGEVLQPAEVAVLEEELRAAARAAGLSVLDPAKSAAAPRDPRKASESLDVAAVVFALAAPSQGTIVMPIGVYKSGTAAPAGSLRLSAKGFLELKEAVRAGAPALFSTALGLAPPPAAAKSPVDPLVQLVQEVTSDVESLRGLRRKSSIKVQVLGDSAFAAALRARAEKELTSSAVAAERARWAAFGLAPLSVDPGRIRPSLLDDQAVAFYDPFSRQVTVRKDAASPDGLRLALAREIEHALQDQNFGFPDPTLDHDAWLARMAISEGDGLAVMNAYGARRARKHVKAAILNAAAMLRAADTETLLRTSGHSAALLKAPAILLEEMALRTASGFALVAEVYRRGGFALVDRMFANPPTSSHQILHPEAYLAGEAPVAITAPAAPKGTRVVASGRLGELGARLMLAACVDKSVASDVTARWAGDWYIVVEGSRRARSVSWLSAWSGGGAEQVANLIRLQSTCWQQAAAAGGMAAAARVRTGGDFVALARGSIDLDTAASAALAARAMPGKAAPPLGATASSAGPARIEEGRFTSAWLALEGAVPEGYERDPANPTAEVSIKRGGTAGGAASISLLGDPLAGEALEKFFETASAQIGAAQGGRPSFTGKAQRALAEGDAEERTWKIEGPALQLRIQVGAFCGGKASLALVRIESSDAAKAALDRFASSIRPTAAAPACAELE
jgi:hypothetical protein